MILYSGGGHEALEEVRDFRRGGVKARAALLQAFVGAADQLAAGGFGLACDGGNFVIAGVEGFTQDEGGALGFRQSLHRPQQGELAFLGEGEFLLDAKRGRFDNGFG